MSSQPTLWDYADATSLPGSQGGSSPSNSQAGPTSGNAGRGHVPVSPSAPPASDEVPPTNGTSGPSSSASSASADLQSFLANRLPQRMACYGSMEYALTWKERATPSGLRICAQRASALRTSASDCSGVPSLLSGYATATVRDTKGSGGKPGRQRLKESGRLPSILCEQARLVGYGTPRASEIGRHRTEEAIARAMEKGGSVSLEDQVHLAGQPSPTAALADKGVRTMEGAIREAARNHSPDLAAISALVGCPSPTALSFNESHMPGNCRYVNAMMEMLTGWNSPSARDFKSESATEEFNATRDAATRGKPLSYQATLGPTSSSCPTETTNTEGSALNPAFSRWLMGFHQSGLTHGWDSCSPGWSCWVLIQKLLSGCSPAPEEIASAVCAVSATR